MEGINSYEILYFAFTTIILRIGGGELLFESVNFELGMDVKLKSEFVSEVSSFLGNEEMMVTDIIKVLCPVTDKTVQCLIRVDGYYCDQQYFEEVEW